LISAFNSKFEINFKIKKLENLIISNSLVNIKYKNQIKMTMIYDIIYLEDYERELFSTRRQEYLFEKKVYNTPLELNTTTLNQTKFNIGYDSPIKDFYYYVQLNKIIDAKQYFNFTFDYILPELNMSTSYKLMYLQQMINLNYYDDEMKLMYDKFIDMMLEKLLKLKYKNPNINLSGVNSNNLKFLYNNLTNKDINIIEARFESYYEKILQKKTISNSILYLNDVERYNIDQYYSNKIIEYQSYNNMIPGLHLYTFSLYPLEYQPSGYANFSSVRPKFQIRLSSNKLTKNDVLNCYMIARSYNIMRFISGISGIAW
jgi:hypothetical protein